MLRFSDPAPSRLFYKLNRLFYRLWFRLILGVLFLCLIGLLVKNFVYDKVDLNEEIRYLSRESSAFYKNLTELSISRIVIKGANLALKKEITELVQITANEGFSALKAQSLRDKIQEIARVKKAFVKFSTDGLVVVDVVERKEAVVFLNNNTYEVLDTDGIILSVNKSYDGLSNFPLIVGKSASKNIRELIWIVEKINAHRSEVLYYEWVGNRRWDIHMRNNTVFKLPEKNLSKGLEIMGIFLIKNNKLLNSLVAVDLRNLEKPIIKLRREPNEHYKANKKERFAS